MMLRKHKNGHFCLFACFCKKKEKKKILLMMNSSRARKIQIDSNFANNPKIH